MHKNLPVVAVRFIDAFCIDTQSDFNTAHIVLQEHVAVGFIFNETPEDIFLTFEEKKGFAYRGLILPKCSLVLEDKNMQASLNALPKPESTVGISWSDIVYFENGKIPEMHSKMYTEGRLMTITDHLLVIENPETIRSSPGKIINHPVYQPYVYVISISLVTHIKVYE